MYTPIELDKIRNLRYGMKAISQFEKILGKNLAKIDMENLTMEEQAVIIWAGLVHEDSSLTTTSISVTRSFSMTWATIWNVVQQSSQETPHQGPHGQ